MIKLDWWYIQSGFIFGPATLGTVRKLVEKGELTHRELVWREGLAQWTPIFRVSELHASPPRHDIYRRPNPYGLPALPTPAWQHSAHPILRFLAQTIDILLVAFLSFEVAPLFGLELRPLVDSPGIADIIRHACLVALTLFAEAPLLALWGTTPGKWMLGLHVRTVQGKAPDIAVALRRQLLLFAAGFVLGLRMLAWYGMWRAWRRQIAGRQTVWDAETDLRVRTNERGLAPFRLLVAGLAITGILLSAPLMKTIGTISTAIPAP